jgi:diacylglycerol kinase
MDKFLRTRTRAFGYAFEGWWYVLRTQRNTWIHAFMSIAVIVMCLWLDISFVEWAVIILTITMVWVAEFFNTSLEALIDLAHPGEHELAKIGKDVSAAAVLITAGASVLIGLLIMGPPLWEKFKLLIADW